MRNFEQYLIVELIAIVYLVAFRLHAKSKYLPALGLLLLGGLALRVYTSTDCFLHDWDERYHALVGKNLLNHFFRPTLYENMAIPVDYTNW